jgi:hypothetical protein
LHRNLYNFLNLPFFIDKYHYKLKDWKIRKLKDFGTYSHLSTRSHLASERIDKPLADFISGGTPIKLKLARCERMQNTTTAGKFLNTQKTCKVSIAL